MLLNKRKFNKKINFVFGFFGKKTVKIDKIWRKSSKFKAFDKIFWNLVCKCFPTKKIIQKNLFSILAFFGLFWPFLAKKRPKLTKNEENWQNPNRSMKFSEIRYVDASQQKKIQQKNNFYFGIFWPFCLPKNAKIDKEWRKSLNLYFNIEVVFFDLINLDHILKIQKK